MKRIFLPLALVALVAATPKVKPVKLPKGPGRDLVQAKCSLCHVMQVVVAKPKSEDQWAQSVDQMISRGAKVSDAEYEVIVGYMTKHYGVKGR